jgi:hypothetical protein
MSDKELLLCACGCGHKVNPGRRFISGHQNIGRKQTDEAKANTSKALKGKSKSDTHRAAISKERREYYSNPEHRKANKDAQLREKDPLPNEWENEKGKGSTNKNCTDYLGCHIAERILEKIYIDVKVMPPNNHGYDFICSQDKKIDVKSSSTGDKGYWQFNITKNKIADYFLCIAFDNRDNLNPVHLWLIPSKIVNHLTMLTIQKSTINKWLEYKQSLDKIILCCDKMKGE